QSLGATYVEVAGANVASDEHGYAGAQSEEFARRQRETLAEHVAAADVVITTALVPGRPAPRIVTADMLRRMRPGSVVVDLAAERRDEPTRQALGLPPLPPAPSPPPPLPSSSHATAGATTAPTARSSR